MSKKVKAILNENNMLNETIMKTNYHMNILNADIDILLNKLSREGLVSLKEGMTEEEVAELLVSLIDKCNMENELYDKELDEEMTRIGLGLNEQISTRNTPNKWDNGGMFHDDGFGVGSELTSSYEDYMDSQGGFSR